jgi:predicted DNA-binding transcriptional regulator AlpA
MLKSNSSSSSNWQFAARRIKNHVRQHPTPIPLGLIMWHTSEIMAAITRKAKRSAKQKSSKTCELQNT